MRLTTVDIHSREFNKGAWGYSIKDVEDFRQEVADNFEEIQLELAAVRAELERATRELEHYRTLEKSMNETLVFAQRSADEVRANAHKEAELVLRGADSEAREIVAQARVERGDIERQIRELETARDRFADDMASMVAALSERIEAVRRRAPAAADNAPATDSAVRRANGESATSTAIIPGWLGLGSTHIISGS